MNKKEVTFFIDNMGYTINIEEKLRDDLIKYLDPNKNNTTKDLFAAYIKLTKEYSQFKDEIQKIDEKLKRFS